MSAKPKPTEGPRPIAVADAHALADRLERMSLGGDLKNAVALIRMLLRGRKPSDVIELE